MLAANHNPKDPFMNPVTEKHRDRAGLAAGVTAEPLPKHLVRIPGEQWAFWRWVFLRGAGFPSYLPLQLAAIRAAAAADRLLVMEDSSAEKIGEAMAEVRRASANAAGETDRRPTRAALRKLKKGRAPNPTGTPADSLLQEVAALLSQTEEARTEFTSCFQSDALEVSTKIREIAAGSRFRQAVLLQNRAVVRTALDPLSRISVGALRSSSCKEKEELVATYLQRYSVKNDTIGFFGPVGWAKLVASKGQLAVHPGPGLVSKSSIYFENWCIESLAEKMSAIKSLRPWMAPRLLPFFRVEETTLYSSGPVSSLPPAQAAILQRCNGESTAREIAKAVIAIPEFGVRTEGQVYGILQAAVSRGIISWAFEIPYCLYPEKKLQDLLDKIERVELRQPLLAELDELERSREKITRAVGDPEQLGQATEALDATFMRLTNRAPTKSAGAMYASRTLIYQECQRDVNVEIGPEIIAALGAPLSLVLNSARWFSYRAAAAYRDAFHEIYEELAQRNKGRKVDLLQFWGRIEPLIFDPVRQLFKSVIPDFQDRWETILRLPWDEQRGEYASAKLRPLAEKLFAAPAAGWQLARYHSPDVMIAASTVDAIRRGDYVFVLGEVHMAQNTIRYSLAVSQHDHPEELLNAFQSDLSQSRAVPVAPRHWPRMTNRTAWALTSPQDYHLEISSFPVANGKRSRTVAISAFAVEHSEQGLIARSWDGSMKFNIIELLGELLSNVAVELIKIVRPRPHVPRITIDNLVVVRESWSFPATELEFIHPAAEHDRYLQVRRWMRRHGLPRFVFVRVPLEVKPFYLDFESPIYVEIFIKLIRRMLAGNHKEGRVTLTEMLPAPDQLWLPDADGRVYTSEFRMVAWDLAEQNS
jgi:hypothetical protein